MFKAVTVLYRPSNILQAFLGIDNNIGKNSTKMCQYVYPKLKKEIRVSEKQSELV